MTCLVVVTMMLDVVVAAMLHFGMPATPPPAITHKHNAAQRGWQPSAYQGRLYDRQLDVNYRRCVGQREGQWVYWITDPDGYYGTYQLTRALGVGAGWMVAKELKRTYPHKVAKRIGAQLRAHTPDKWTRFYADMAFWVILRGGTGHGTSGAKHWAGGNWSCTPGMTFKPSMGWYGANA